MNKNHEAFNPSNSAYADNWEFLSTYIKEMDTCFRNLKYALEDKDTIKARAELHQMLGATRILSYTGLESKILSAQRLVKGQGELNNASTLLSHIETYIEGLFTYLQQQRPFYRIHLLSYDSDAIRMIEGVRSNSKQINFSDGKTLEDSIEWLSAHDTDLILYDYDGNHNKFLKYSDLLASSGIEVPLLLFTEYFGPTTPGCNSDIPNLYGRMLKSASSDLFMESVKWVANGRAFWRINSDSKDEMV